MFAHLLVSEYVYETEKWEQSRLKDQLPGVFRALSWQDQKFVSGSVRDHQTHLERRKKYTLSVHWFVQQ